MVTLNTIVLQINTNMCDEALRNAAYTWGEQQKIVPIDCSEVTTEGYVQTGHEVIFALAKPLALTRFAEFANAFGAYVQNNS